MGWRIRVLRLGLGLGFEGWEERKKKVRMRRERAKRRRRGFGVRRFVGWCFFQAFAIGESERGERVEECVFLENFCGFSGKMEDWIFDFPKNPKKEERLDLDSGV